jgi:hypothetical protein
MLNNLDILYPPFIGDIQWMDKQNISILTKFSVPIPWFKYENFLNQNPLELPNTSYSIMLSSCTTEIFPVSRFVSEAILSTSI